MRRVREIRQVDAGFEALLRLYRDWVEKHGRKGITKWKERLWAAVSIPRYDSEMVKYFCDKIGLSEEWRDSYWFNAGERAWKDEEARKEREADKRDR